MEESLVTRRKISNYGEFNSLDNLQYLNRTLLGIQIFNDINSGVFIYTICSFLIILSVVMYSYSYSSRIGQKSLMLGCPKTEGGDGTGPEGVGGLIRLV